MTRPPGLGRGRVSSRMHKLADEELMGLVQSGNADAFEVIYDRHCDAAYSLAYRMCGRRVNAEDVLQDAFLAVWRTAVRYECNRGSVRNWVLRIVHNRAVDALRRGVVRERRAFHEDGIVERLEGPGSTEEDVVDRERSREVRGALDGLPREQSRVVELAYYGGFTHTEIASMLEMPVGTVKGRMRLALAKLRLAMDDENEGVQG
jgi:RNA polymerase sigma-70 factor, ECF subfamily